MRKPVLNHLAAAAAALLLLTATAARSDEFLGEEPAGGGADEEEADGAEAPPPKRPRSAPKSASGAKADEPDSGTWSGSGGLGAGKGYVSAQVTIGYFFNRWVGVQTTGYYSTFSSGDDAGTEYGPEVDGILRLANPTIVTPFVGAGPGYTRWVRKQDGKIFDDASGLTANAFGGLHVALTRHFGLQVIRKQVTWVTDPPRRYGDHDRREEKTQMTSSIGFHVSF